MPIHRAVVTALVFVAAASTALANAIPDRNINMVSGREWPGGDPFLQRQNEPSIAVSTRNPLHLLAGANDYRTVDIPGLEDIKVIGDAWLGVFRSYDGGNTWTSTLLPGYPQDGSSAGMNSPLKGYPAGADPVVRAGANGIFYYAGITLSRDANPLGALFVARYLDHNDKESSHFSTEEAHSIRYVDTNILSKGTSGQFNDKPWMAVDIPRPGATPCTVAGRLVEGGNVYVAWTILVGGDENIRSRLLITRSTDCGATWQKPTYLSETHAINQGASVAIDPVTGNVYVVWRRIRNDKGETDALLFAKSTDLGKTFSPAQLIREIQPYEQGTTDRSFRTTNFPSMTVDGNGGLHVVWSQRGFASANEGRIVIISSTNAGASWTAPRVVDSTPDRGHQFMPSITFANGKLTVIYYDQRDDHTVGSFQYEPVGGGHIETRREVGDLLAGEPGKVFWDFIVDALPPPPPTYSMGIRRRHTLDVWTAQSAPGESFFETARASQYMYGTPAGSPGVKRPVEQLQFNPPNLPLFRQGTVPFIGDYIDVGSRPFIRDGNGWRFNTTSSTAPVFHAVWTDNRDVRPPADGNWRNYTPVFSPANDGTSKFDGGTVPPCKPGQTGMRNQNIYTTRITRGLFAGSPGNAKPLGKFQRAFAVFVQNTLKQTKTYRLTILNQPPGGKASFLQIPQSTFPDPLLILDVTVPARSTIARSVFVTSSDPRARVEVDVREFTALGGVPVPGGLQTTVVLNPDAANPDLTNPNVADPDVTNPDVANAEVYNPDVANPDVANPDVANPDVANPDVANPDVANPDVANPDVANPDVANPDVANPDVANPDVANPDVANPDVANQSLTDTTWTTTNTGNTSATFSVNLLLNGDVPDGFITQLILHRTYTTPIARGCGLGTQRHTIVMANIRNPELLTDPAQLLASDITDGDPDNATIWLEPGGAIHITLRVLDPDIHDDITFNAAEQVAPVLVSHAINTADLNAGATTPSISLAILSTRIPDARTDSEGQYSHQLQAVGGVGTKTWSSEDLPAGFFLSPSGLLEGTVPPAGTYPFHVTVTDSRPLAPQSKKRLIELRSVDPLFVTTEALSDGAPDTPYFAVLTHAGGTSPYRWSLTGGALPAGLTLSSDGTISGTPAQPELAQFTVQIEDGTYPAPQIASQTFEIEISGERTFFVTTTSDSGAGSLRQAILDSNTNKGFVDTIRFALTGEPPHRISPASGLPGLDDPVVVDGTAAGACGGAPAVWIDGSSAGAAHGLVASSGGTTIRGLSITGFDTSGFAGLFFSGGSGSVVECSYIGVAPNGTAAANAEGIRVAGSFNNIIGGTAGGLGNVISGNLGNGIAIIGPSGGEFGFGMNTTIQGNRIGTDPTGTVDLGNATNGIHIVNSGGNTVGGAGPAARNVISGNNGEGVRIDGRHAADNVIHFNYIGTNAAGSAAIGNNASGVYIRRAPSNTVLDNLISGNLGFAGVAICGDPAFCGGGDFGTQDSRASGNEVKGNLIGTNASGTGPLGNGARGVSIDGALNNTIGGTAAGEGNVIAANRLHGIHLFGTVPSGNVIRGNAIGTDGGGAGLDLGNGGDGVRIDSGSGNIIGEANGTGQNAILFNGGAGIALPTAGAGNLLRYNRLVNNTGLGIDLGTTGVTANDAADIDDGPNGLQNFPLFDLVTDGSGTARFQGTLHSTPDTEFVIDFFHSAACDESGNGEGDTWLGSTSLPTDAKGNLVFDSTINIGVSAGFVTALATSPDGNTSEFSPCASVTPLAGGALRFDGDDDIVTIDDSESLDLQNLTVEAWVWIESEHFTQAPIVSKGADYGNYTLEVGGADGPGTTPFNINYVHRVAEGNFSCCSVIPGPITYGMWNHVAATFENGTARVYLNGALVSSVSNGGPPLQNGEPVRLGLTLFQSAPHRFLQGELDEVRIWNVARTATEIAQNYKKVVDPASPGLVAYYRFDERGGETVTDLSPFGNDGVLADAGFTLGLDVPQRVTSTAPIEP